MIRVWLVALISVVSSTIPVSAQQRTCIQLRQAYDAGPIPKAYAASPNDKCGFASARSASTLAGAKAQALQFCISAGGVNCKVVASQR